MATLLCTEYNDIGRIRFKGRGKRSDSVSPHVKISLIVNWVILWKLELNLNLKVHQVGLTLRISMILAGVDL